jgi:hypothetical protein
LIRTASKKIKKGVAVQDGDYVNLDPKTGKAMTVAEMVAFAKNYLRLDYVFWCTEKPFYSEGLVKELENG